MIIKDYKLSEIIKLCKKTGRETCEGCPLFADFDNVDETICQELFGSKIPCEWRVEVE